MKREKRAPFTKLATATSVERIEQYVNEYYYSTTYRVDPSTLAITNATCKVPEKIFVEPFKGGYVFGRR